MKTNILFKFRNKYVKIVAEQCATINVIGISDKYGTMYKSCCDNNDFNTFIKDGYEAIRKIKNKNGKRKFKKYIDALYRWATFEHLVSINLEIDRVSCII